MNDPVQQLHEIPDLAVEAYLTWNHPNPGDTSEKTGKHLQGSKPPTDLAVLDALRPDPDAQGKSIRGSLMACVWAVHDETSDTPELPEQTFSHLCTWLRATSSHWNTRPHAYHPTNREPCRNCPDGIDSLDGYITHTIANCHRELARLCRLQPARHYTCTVLGCHAKAELQPGSRWLRCHNGHTLDIQAERGRFLAMQDWTLTETRSAISQYLGLDISINTLKTWRKRDKIQPINPGERPERFNFAAVCRHLEAQRLKQQKRLVS